MLEKLKNAAGNIAFEFAELERLMSADNERFRRLVFYSEGALFYRYFEDYIDYLLANSDLDICYITSDRRDPIFSTENQRIKPFYIKHLLASAFARLDAKCLVMTVPDLGRGAVKRAPEPVHHVYIFHSVGSIHQKYRCGAFDFYDTIFCLAPHQVAELRKTEELYGLKPKNLLITGYPLLERLWRERQQVLMQKEHGNLDRRQLCLVAPTWGKSSIMAHGIERLLDNLNGTQFDVLVRPHPQTVRDEPKVIDRVSDLVRNSKNIQMQLNNSSMQSFIDADIMISEWSGAAYEFALGTERPAVFVDTPLRIDNLEWAKVDMEVVENTCRADLGYCLPLSELDNAGSIVQSVLDRRQEFPQQLAAIRDTLVSNWQHSAEIGANYIIERCTSAGA